MKEQSYESFLIDKINDEHTLTHMLQQEVNSQRKRIGELLKDMSSLRRSQNDLKLRSKQLEEKMAELLMQNRKLKDTKFQKVREVAEIRKKQQKSSEMDSKQIFKMYLDNTFPKYKGMIKKILKLVYIIEDTQKQQPQKKIKIYRSIFQNGVKKVLDWLFPKKSLNENKKQLAQQIVSNWKKQEQSQRNNLSTTNQTILKQAAYIKQIQELEAKILVMKSSMSMMEGRLKTYERSLSAKGSQFVAHLKKLLQSSPELEYQGKEKVEQVLHLFNTVINLLRQKIESRQQQKSILNNMPLVLSQPKTQLVGRKKAAPILKKNIFGYYQQPQFAGNYTLPSSTKHVNNNKATQTLPEDLCILTLHPVIMVTLIDGNIKPQRTRHNQQHYVTIKINQDKYVESAVRQSLQPVWNQPFLLKDYDFPFIHVQLIHKSKGLRDYALGGGKFSASSEEQKIVNVRKEKQFVGRVRFSVSYPKGNIFELKITSVTLQLLGANSSLKQQVCLKFPYNGEINLQFTMPEKIIYTDKSVIILQTCEEKLKVSMAKQDLHDYVLLKEFTEEGNKQVTVIIDNSYKVVIQGEVYLLVCENQQPERISQETIEGGKGKFFSVRAPPPIITVTYHQTALHSNIKFPLVFFLQEQFNSLSIIRELSNRQLQQEKVDEIVNNGGYLKLSQFIKAPSKIYKVFIETLQGEEVVLKHQNNLFERLLKEVHLQVSYKQEQIQQINYNRKNRNTKQSLFKQFTIQSKELMLNHYKVFTRHFKRIGFVKFKLGYTIYDNLLTTQSYQVQIKKPQTLPLLQDGLYFIQIEVTSAHLNSKSNNQYAVRINQDVLTRKVKGKHAVWKENYTFSFELKEKLQFEVRYQLIEYTTFGQQIIYQGKILVDQRIISLGAYMVKLDDKGQDCLHFGKITLPSQLYHLGIDSVEAEVEEEADWVGKIDPYLILSSNNAQLLKTNYLDDIGSHPVWQNINRHIFVTKEDDEQAIVSCRVYDYDLIGKDDYIGQVVFTEKVNPELTTGEKSKILYGSIVKQNRTCGSMKIKGVFEKIRQPQLKVRKNEVAKLNRKDVVYKLVLYEVAFVEGKQMEGDNIKLSLTLNQQKKDEYNFKLGQHKQKQFSFVRWGYRCQQLVFDFQTQYTSFFKNYTQHLGTFSVTVTRNEFKIAQSQIVNQKGQTKGHCRWFVECYNRTNYALITDYLSCRPTATLLSDFGAKVQLVNDVDHRQKEPLLLVYSHNYTLQLNNKEEKNVVVNQSTLSSEVVAFVSGQQTHEDIFAYMRVEKDLLFETKLQERSAFNKIVHDRNFKQIKYLHWEPYTFRQKHNYNIIACFKDTSHDLIYKPNSSGIFNQLLVLDKIENSIIFQANNIPHSIRVVDNETGQWLELPLKGDISRVFVPKKGALYCQIEDYNDKSVLQLNFKYMFIRFKDDKLNGQLVSLQLIAANNQKVKAGSILGQNCFAISNFHLFIRQPSGSNIVFFQAELKSQQKKDSAQQTKKKIKFGLRLEQNKSQYRFVQTDEAVIHAQFDSCVIERKYERTKPVDNTLYGISFVKLTNISFQLNTDATDRQLYLQLVLSNQHQKLILQRNKGSNIYSKQTHSIFYIEKYVLCEATLVEQGILSNKIIGKASFQLSEALVRSKEVHLKEQVKLNNQLVGKLQLTYSNIEDIEFTDLNFFSYLSQYQDMGMTAELQEFGPGKEKYQSLKLTSKGNIQRLESQDSFIIFGDVRNYQINVFETDSKKMLGQFKLLYRAQKQASSVVLQPLRTSRQSLNGLLVIEYENKRSSKTTFEMNKDKQIGLVRLGVHNINCKDKQQSKEYCLRLKTAARCITHLPHYKSSSENRVQFLIYDYQNAEVSLLNEKYEILGAANILAPYNHHQDRVIVFFQDKLPTAICSLTTHYITDELQLTKMREIAAVEATDLIDTEYFVKMKPYLEIEDQNEKMFKYVSDLGLGREKIYWKLNIITNKMLSFTVKDKDMFFDDLIGSAVLPQNSTLQKDESVIEMALFSAQEQNRKGGNGKIKITSSPVISKYNKSKTQQMNKWVEVRCLMLRLGGISRAAKTMELIDEIEVELQNSGKRCVVFTGKYNKDLLFYLQNRDLEIVVDTMAFDANNTTISINLKKSSQLLHYQAVSLGHKSQRQSENIFQLCQAVPLKMKSVSVRKVYCWLYQKFREETQVFFVSEQSIVRGNVLMREKRLLITQPMQLCNLNTNALQLHVLENKSQLFRINLNSLSLNQNQCHFYGAIQNQHSKPIGHYYIQTGCFYSQGQEQIRTVYIGKSRKKWLCITIIEAILTKDVEFFSKMDPYCKFSIPSPFQVQTVWRKTAVQDNIGMHPIWNDSFFVELKGKEETQKVKFVVMDSQVTIDRKIGEATIAMGDLLSASKQRQMQLFYSEKQRAGRLMVRSIVVSKYIVIRHIERYQQKEQDIFMLNIQSKGQERVRILERQTYPIEQSSAVIFSCQNEELKYTFSQLKSKPSCRVVFTHRLVSVHYEIYE